MGGILRLLIIAVLIYLAYAWLRKLLNKPINDTSSPSVQHLMKKCAYCQIHIPEHESTQSQGYYFCNPQHRDLYLQQK